IHAPNDDRLFPGRHHDQIVGEVTEEWAADRIIAHRGTNESAMFEVLWKSGDRTWLNVNQARDLKLIDAYLELMGADKIDALEEGTGEPPSDDPQIYLGNLNIAPTYKYKVEAEGATALPNSVFPPTDLSIPSPTSLSDTITLSCNPIMPRDSPGPTYHGYHPYPNHQQRHGQYRHDKGRSHPGGYSAPPKHPYFTLQEDTQRVNVQTDRQGPIITYISPVQVRLFLEFDKSVNQTSPGLRGQLVVPLGYHDFAQTYNSVPRDRFKWRVSELKKTVVKGDGHSPDDVRWDWVIPRDSETLKFPAIHTFFLDKNYDVLRKIKVLNGKGIVDEDRALMLEKAFD
ncbi:hypothetical protein H0H92_013237, partial [Tricholoma furcatifolium]